MRPLLRRVVIALALLSAGLSTIAACDSCGRPDAGSAGPADVADAGEEASVDPAGDDEPPSSALDYDGSPGDLGKRFREAGPRIEAGAGDAEAPIDPACTGVSLSIVSVLLDPKCAIGMGRVKQLRTEIEATGSTPLKQEAKLDLGPSATPDGIRVELKLVNIGKTTLKVPLNHHSKLPAFTAVAEDAHKAIYELEPPKLELVTDSPIPRFAVMALAPGGKATAMVNVSTGITRRLAPDCEAGSSCAPPKLPKGKYTLHIGQILTVLEAGTTAQVELVVR